MLAYSHAGLIKPSMMCGCTRVLSIVSSEGAVFITYIDDVIQLAHCVHVVHMYCLFGPDSVNIIYIYIYIYIYLYMCMSL